MGFITNQRFPRFSINLLCWLRKSLGLLFTPKTQQSEIKFFESLLSQIEVSEESKMHPKIAFETKMGTNERQKIKGSRDKKG